MLRAVGGLFLGFAFVFLAVFWVRTCLPNPNDEEIDWLHREDVIVVQKVVADPTSGGPTMAVGLPVFTLYGDGTLITADQDANPSTYRKTTVPEDTIYSLLRLVDRKGFFSLQYDPPTESVASTYIYVATKSQANAVRVEGPDLQAFAGGREKLQDIQTIDRRLGDIAIQADEARSYMSDEIFVVVVPAPNIGLFTLEWPFPEVDLAEIVVEADSSRRFTGQQAQELSTAIDSGRVFEQHDAPFSVAYRPVLPYEENFPEFEPPTP